MKLNKIATAVSISLAALALTACGSDKKASKPSTPSVQPSKPDTSAAEKEQANIKLLAAAAEKAGLTKENAEKLAKANSTVVVDSEKFKDLVTAALAEQNKTNGNPGAGANQANNPTSEKITASNPTIDGFNTEKVLSVSTKHYERQNDSTFDEYANKDKNKMASSGDSTFLKVTNPYLSNFVIASEGTADKIYAVVSLGEEATPTGRKDGSGKKIEAEATDYLKARPSDAADRKPIDTRNGDGTEKRRLYIREDAQINQEQAIRTIQEENGNFGGRTGNNIKVVSVSTTNNALKVFQTNQEGDLRGQSGLIGYKGGKLTYGAEENVYEISPVDGLSHVNKELAATRNHVARTTTYPNDPENVANNLTTRVFGKNYRTYETGNTGKQVTHNSYVAQLLEKDKNGDVRLEGTVKTVPLQYVQYGRLTANLDALVKDPHPDGKEDLIYRQFEQHGARGTVDTYFYRGTHSTTLTQMADVKKAGGTLQYYGHALTYGIGPTADSQGGGLPTSWGGKATTLGNFVEAKFNTATNQVTGSIYNLINEDDLSVNRDYKKQELVTFKGVVSGNTVADGVSTKLGATPEQGSFVASFYGDKAQELGGNVSSVTKNEGYGQAKWGAVFGATLGESSYNFSTGQAK